MISVSVWTMWVQHFADRSMGRKDGKYDARWIEMCHKKVQILKFDKKNMTTATLVLLVKDGQDVWVIVCPSVLC